MSDNKYGNENDEGSPQLDGRSKKYALNMAMILILLGVYKIMVGHVSDASLSIVSGFFLLLFTKIEYLKSISALGLKAELHSKIVEADDLIKRLRELSIPLTEMLFSVTARSGTYQQLSRAGQHCFVKRVSQQLKSLGIDDARIDSVKKDYYYVISVQMTWAISDKLETFFNEKLQEIREGIEPNGQDARERDNYYSEKAYYLKTRLYDSRVNNPYDIVVDFLTSLDRLTEDDRASVNKLIHEELEDLKELVTKHTFRRPDVWFT